jgi:photosystem II stability/assembly factor-like uncharacterized protein
LLIAASWLIPRAAYAALTCAVGSNGAVVYTTDEGSSWSCQHLGAAAGPDNISFYGVSFSDASNGWAVGPSGDPRIFHTADGGQTWEAQFRYSGRLYDVSFPNSSHGWAAGIRGSILHTNDGGKKWVPQFTGTSILCFWGIDFADNLNGWVAGDAGTVLHTDDGGTTWQPQRSCTETRLWDVCFVDPLNGWAAGDAGTLIHTSDGGNQWAVQNMGTTEQIDAIDFVDVLNGWAIGRSIWHTSDGGATWTSQISDLGHKTLNDIAFSDSLNGWAVTYNAILQASDILHTTDGGATWQVQPTVEQLQAIVTIPEPASLALVIAMCVGGLRWIAIWGRDKEIERIQPLPGCKPQAIAAATRFRLHVLMCPSVTSLCDNEANLR